jgi:hypothetical protein
VLVPLLKLQLPRVPVLLVLLLKPLVQVQRVVPQVLQQQALPARLQRVL